ncbi:MAG: hypothetical protein NTW87_05685 [Planctomycetota bacterium]|nr:hypothetical protein [Planctomycetota bacterium]
MRILPTALTFVVACFIGTLTGERLPLKTASGEALVLAPAEL